MLSFEQFSYVQYYKNLSILEDKNEPLETLGQYVDNNRQYLDEEYNKTCLSLFMDY